jgi:hypothetical protein
MGQVSGVVQRHSEKPWNGKTFYSLALSGQDGWYNTGMKRPPAVGTSVKFNTKQNARGFNEVDGSIEIVADAEAAPAASVAGVATASAKAGGGSQSAYWDRKEARDITNDANRELGASRNTAIAFIDLAIKNEVIKLPAAAKREEFLWTLLDKYTNKLMGKDDGSGNISGSTDSGATTKGAGASTQSSGATEAAGLDIGDGDIWS